MILCVSLVFFVWMAENIPYTHDDWLWGVPQGFRNFIEAELNSRYSGNLIVLLLTRFKYFKIAFMGAVFTLIPLLCTELAFIVSDEGENKYSASSRIILFLFCSALILSMPRLMWRQTYGWVSGFANFVVSIPLVLGYIFILTRLADYNERSKIRTVIVSILLFSYALSSQMFIENLTLYIVLISVIYFFYRLVQHKNIPLLFWPMFVGAVVGCAAMFSSSLYQTLFQQGEALDGLRRLNFNVEQNLLLICFDIIENYIEEIIPRMTSGSGVICAVASILLLLKSIEVWWQKKLGNYSLILICINTFLVLYYLLSYHKFIRDNSALWISAETLISPMINIFFIVFVVFELNCFYKDNRAKLLWAEFVWISPLLAMAPLAAVEGWGDRNFLTSYVFYVAFCAILLLDILIDLPQRRRFSYVLVGFCAVVFASQICKFYGIYREIGTVNWEREVLIQGAIDGEYSKILMPTYENWRYLWGQDPNNSKQFGTIDTYRKFYGIPDNVELWFETWGDAPEVWHLPGNQ